MLLTFGGMLAGTADRWQGGWAETATEAHTALLIALPLAAAAGCWQGGRERRRGTEELWATTVRPPLARLLIPALPVALWVAAGYLVAVAAALLATWPLRPGRPGRTWRWCRGTRPSWRRARWPGMWWAGSCPRGWRPRCWRWPAIWGWVSWRWAARPAPAR
ncbi:hypothetical protein LT493_02755 [Streptomyces tricolor]|nr:hypothetical protein [Streptomyces tricolor]